MQSRRLAVLLPVAATIAVLMISASSSPAQSTPATPTPVPLWPGAAPMAQGTTPEDIPTITTYLPRSNPTRTGVIIAPGGGYGHLSMQKEGEDIALWLNAHGVAGFVLKYRLGPKYHHPVELGDAQRAIRTVRANAQQLGLAPDRIGMWGFSAGGHLAASAGTLYEQGPPAGDDAIAKQSARPSFLILAYPVISMDVEFAHMGSRLNLLGERPDPALVELLSPDKQVTRNTPAAFLVATTDDNAVPVMNSVLFYSALVKAKVAGAEIHLFEHGPHGIGLAPQFPDLKDWPDLLATWMTTNGWMATANATPAR